MNREFRRLIKRSCPKGSLSPIAKVLKNLQAKLPALDADQLIPNALHAIKQTIGEKERSAKELWLNIKARRHDQFAALFVELEGTLDHLNAKELLDRVRQAAERARMDVIVNFEHLKHATPAALQTLLDGETLKAMAPHAKVRYRKFKESFEAALDEISLSGLELLEEER
jgi:anti-anti-sigma regulatory factor